ncbi:succinyldiaminopimelate transaminase [Mumia zhuanghuii]|uniref:Aminotransferase n=2 Tax=Mumia TaxID=1546255 RepID=A0ABW1QF57_9ACTN|nr:MULTISPECIES: succinyldiaminopimelate transaminase [Mumia]KAA1422679.1 succinyldiaminopimelate transaminase [Mumia zhuanghuii]
MLDPTSSAPPRPSVAARLSSGAVSQRLPDFPWDSLAEVKARAAAHPDGIVDLSIGTPVDSTPLVAQVALTAAADAPGYPQTVGTPALRQSAVDWLARRHGVTGLDIDGVLPAIGSKELIGAMALHLGLGAGDTVVIPELAYPTYAVGARLAGCDVVVSDSTVALGPTAPAIMWINSPSNPSGRVLGADHLRKTVEWARERGVLLISDECYLECAWDTVPQSILHPDISGGSHDGILAVHSLSKRSNLAGYRAAFVAGDTAIVKELLEVRKNLGLIMPGPIQHAMRATLDDDTHADAQHALYAARRAVLRDALLGAGFRIDHSEAALYLWATRDEPARDTVAALAEIGVLVAPGEFYGAAGARHVRIAFTATDERIATAADRLASFA